MMKSLFALAVLVFMPMTTHHTVGVSALEDPPEGGCRGPGGKVIEGMVPGGRWMSSDGCTMCRCGPDGHATCISGSCPMPECADMVTTTGVCCPTCPNGLTCRTPEGAIIKEGEHLVEDDHNCTCSAGVSKYNMRSYGPGPSATCIPLPPDECDDSDSNCRYWASTGQCGENPGFMLPNCRKSCAVCESECEDSNDYCESWAADGYCDLNPVWMLDNCAKSCNACSPRIGETA
ncbi:zinc metalloproteinase nas-14-like [Littorina saxatilis]|uniref:zinc metalloproteinase nas-14-like n=1 Tax=Littorina saxatilis TaxID=31220 RepID=UPI0038B4ED09